MGWAVAVTALVLAGCGGDDDADAGDGGGGEDAGLVVTAAEVDWTGATPLPDGWTMQMMAVDDLRVGDGSIEVDAVFVPIRLADGACVGEVGGSVNMMNEKNSTACRSGVRKMPTTARGSPANARNQRRNM